MLSLFIISPRHADAFAVLCARTGWAATFSDRIDSASAEIAHSPAGVVVIDQRGEPDCATAVAAVATLVERRRGALLVVLDRGGSAEAACAAGATHVAVDPASEGDLLAALRLAVRGHERLVAPVQPDPPPRSSALSTPEAARAWVERLIGVADCGDPPAIVLQMAIGRFGQLNAAYGRSVADKVLELVEQRLCDVATTLTIDGHADGRIWATRMVTRLAGAEFALILAPPSTLSDGANLGRHIARSFDVPFNVDGHSIHLGCRIGVAAVRRTLPASLAAETAFRHASIALAAARSRPPGAVETFDAPPDADHARRMADLESDLHAALEAGEVDLLFQPQVDLESNRILGVEALVRWHHPTLGQLPAQTLLDVAASAEFAIRLGTYIHQRALLAAADWPRSLDGLRLAVNASAADLAAPGFLARLSAALAASGFPPVRLTLEVTETDLMQDLVAAAAVLGSVRARGIEIALDDFGTGYSSLAYLKTLPLDQLKVDKRLIGDLAGSARDRIIVKGVVDMAHALGIRVLAEGVETEAQRARVAATGCDAYQGFLCTKPLTTAELVDFVATWDARAAAA